MKAVWAALVQVHACMSSPENKPRACTLAGITCDSTYNSGKRHGPLAAAGLSQNSLLFYNNAMALPLMAGYMFVATREVQDVQTFPQRSDPMFLVRLSSFFLHISSAYSLHAMPLHRLAKLAWAGRAACLSTPASAHCN